MTRELNFFIISRMTACQSIKFQNFVKPSLLIGGHGDMQLLASCSAAVKML